MFGNLMGNFEEQQRAMKARLALIEVQAEAGNGAIKITANGNQEITNIKINKEALDWDDAEQVEDLMMIAANRVIKLAAEKAAEEAQKMMKDMLPPGMGDFGNLFG